MYFDGDLLRRELKQRGMTLEQLADAIDVNEREVRRLVNEPHLVIDKRNVLVILVKIAEYLKMQPYDLVKARVSAGLRIRAIFGSDIGEHVLRQTCALDQLAYPAGTEGTPEIGLRWLALDPDAIVAVSMVDTGTILGYVTSLLVSDATIDALMRGTLRDLDLGLTGDVERVDNGTLYVVSALLDARIHERAHAFTCLFNGFLTSVRRRTRSGCRIRRIVAEATEPHGPMLCKRLRMTPIGVSVRRTPFYELDLDAAKTLLGCRIARAAHGV